MVGSVMLSHAQLEISLRSCWPQAAQPERILNGYAQPLSKRQLCVSAMPDKVNALSTEPGFQA